MKYLKLALRLILSSITLGLLVTLGISYTAYQFYINKSAFDLETSHSTAGIQKPLLALLNRLHHDSVDMRLRQRGLRKGSDDVAILVADEYALEKIGRWPWPRSVIAQAIQKTLDNGAKVIGFDAVFSEEDKSTAYPV